MDKLFYNKFCLVVRLSFFDNWKKKEFCRKSKLFKDECLGTKSWRRTWYPAISFWEQEIRLRPEISELLPIMWFLTSSRANLANLNILVARVKENKEWFPCLFTLKFWYTLHESWCNCYPWRIGLLILWMVWHPLGSSLWIHFIDRKKGLLPEYAHLQHSN